MRIKKDKVEEFRKWMAYMQGAGEITAISFFNSICFYCEKGSDAVKIVSNALQLQERDRPYCVTLNDIYLAMCTFSNFHEWGDDFRRRWNAEEMWAGYSRYIEEGRIKHVAQPFAYHTIFDSELFADFGDDEDDDDNPDTWKGPGQ